MKDFIYPIRFVFFLAGLLAAGFPMIGSALAQSEIVSAATDHPNDGDNDENSDGDNNVDFDKIPDEYILESKSVFQRCKSNSSLYMYYDCKCRALSFLEQRIEKGPEYPKTSIEFALQKTCRDATEAAGAEYNSCLIRNGTMQPGTDPEKLCECYANRYVELIDLYAPMIQSRTLSPIKVQARIECENPALARKLFHTAVPRP